ncbi:MAG: hypothetical protein HQK49_06105 [Oligoflexia bacterium]|nr:hypothetical protein [Oligoflexia bacterium]
MLQTISCSRYTKINLTQRLIFGVAIVVIIFGIYSNIPQLLDNDINYGQIAKQTYAAGMARSLSSGDRYGIIPYRHFLEIYHDKVSAWAEEFPIYIWSVVFFHKISSLPLLICGKLLNFLIWILAICFSYKLGGVLNTLTPPPSPPNTSESTNKSTNYSYLHLSIPFFVTYLPIFRIYAKSFMPEMGMILFLILALYSATLERHYRVAFFIMIASLFKFYALFFGLGIFLIYRKSWFAYFLSAMPIMFYIFAIYYLNIANPLKDNFVQKYSGHFFTLELLADKHLYGRILNWIFIKNLTIPGSIFVLSGVIVLLFKQKNMISFFAYLLFMQFIFAFLLAKGFYIHDYYSIQICLILAIIASYAISYVISSSVSILSNNFNFKMKSLLISLSISMLAFVTVISFMYLSLDRVKKSLKVVEYLNPIVDRVVKQTSNMERILIISDRNPEYVVFSSNRVGWFYNYIQYGDFAYKHNDKKLREIEERLKYMLKNYNISAIITYFIDANAGYSFRHNLGLLLPNLMSTTLQISYKEILINSEVPKDKYAEIDPRITFEVWRFSTH